MFKEVWKAVEAKANETEVAKRIEKGRKKEKEEKPKRKRTMKIKKVAEEWKIQNEEEEIVKLKEKIKKLVLEHFHQQIYIFEKKNRVRGY